MARFRELAPVLAVCLAACAPPRIADDGSAFAEVDALLKDECIDRCHEPGGLAYWHDMSGDTYERIVGRHSDSTHNASCSLVEPGDPDRSLIWHKILGTHLDSCNVGGSQMPLHRDDLRRPVPLPADEIELIEAWILDGAPP